MTKAELEKEAEEYADGIYHYKINVSDYGEDGIINYRYSDVKEAYLAGAEPSEKRIAELEKENAELKEFYEKEYFEIADRTADEKIKELEKYQTEVTVDDYSPYDENTWGDMHEEWFVPKGLVRDLLKESYALSEHRKDQLAKAKEILKSLYFIIESRIDYKNNIEIADEMWRAEQFWKGEK